VSEIWTQHRQLALSIANQYWVPGAERQDVEQEALIALWVAARDFDGRGTFAGFARMVIRRRLYSMLRNAGRHHAQVLTEAERDDNLLIDGRDDVHRNAVARERLAAILATVPTLTARERDGLEAHLNGRVYSHDRRLINGIQGARRKMRAAA
jgi:RNA polymerase sigma factor (sigma-70 family)